MRMATIVIAILSTSCACTQKVSKPDAPVPEVPPSPSLPDGDGLGTPLGDLCVHLREIHCREGSPKTLNGTTRTCYATLTLAARTAPIDITCSMRAPSAEVIRGCGDPTKNTTIRCLAP